VSISKENSLYSKIPIKGFYTNQVYIVQPNDTLSYARKIMFKYNISRVVVSDNGKVVGILSLRDIALILTKLGSDYPESLSLITVKKVMKNKVITLPTEANAKEACEIMYHEKIGSVVILQDNELTGIFSKTDACKVFQQYPIESIKVRDVMSSRFANVNIFSSFNKIVEKFIEGFDIVIVEDNKNPVGVITLSKIATMDENEILKSKSSLIRGNEEFTKIKIGNVAERLMYKIDIAININEKLIKAVNLILGYNLPALPVIDINGEIVGTISKNDVVKIIAMN
jgi:CBS domain-containing protein